MEFLRPSCVLFGLALALGSAGCTGTVGGVIGEQPDGPGSDAGPGPGPDSGAGNAPLLLSEIMYHPVLEESFEERHEFVEIYNPTDGDVSLDGWSLGGGIAYQLPAGSVAPARGYVVVAKNRDALLAEYELDADAVYGDYEGELDNGSDTVLLVAPDQRIADAVTYDDGDPWPVEADALGAGEQWLAEELQPLEQHRYRGHSLERVSFEIDAFEVANWEASALDQPTPGQPNGSARATPRAIVLSASAVALESGERIIRAGDEVLVRVRMSELGAVAGVELDYHVDDLARDDETIETVPLRDDGAGGDEIAGDRTFTAVLPAQPEESIVRYRVRVTGDGETRQAWPRERSPQKWKAYFVSPEVDSDSRVYQLYIAPERWTEMWTNIDAGRVSGGAPNPTWNDKVPAVFVHDGTVYDVRVRHQGSRYQRKNGAQINNWPGPGPEQPDPLRALSWRVSFPRYARFEGKGVITLNKLVQSCPGLTAGVGMRLHAEAGVPAAKTRYARVHINGYYYRYMLELERPGDDMLERFHAEYAQQNPGYPHYKVGHLFKATGYHGNEGPYAPADGDLLGPRGDYSATDRYMYTYDRKTHKWQGAEGHQVFISLIEGMHQAREDGREALRAYLGEQFDLDLALSYLAIMNWSVPFDDMFHNHYIYLRREDDKWLFMPWDLDRNFGDWRGARNLGAASSIYVGEENDPDNRDGFWNYFKDSFLDAYREEFEQRLGELNQTLLHPDNVIPIVDEVAAAFDAEEAGQALAPASCDLQGESNQVKQFARDRHEHVNNLLGLD